jgi:hypothetical protein
MAEAERPWRWPLRVAEARSRARGFPLALSDDDAGFIGIG